MEDYEDYNDKIEDEFKNYERASVQVNVLLGQALAVIVAVALCTQWWHYALLVLICLVAAPLWGNMHANATNRWWDKKIAEVPCTCGQCGVPLTQTTLNPTVVDNTDATVFPPAPNRTWPFNMGERKPD